MQDRFRLGDAIPLQSPIASWLSGHGGQRQVNDTLDRVQKAVEEFFKKTRTTLFEFDKAFSPLETLFGLRGDLETARADLQHAQGEAMKAILLNLITRVYLVYFPQYSYRDHMMIT